jgi:subtilisin-like proprotein convertase family protein
MIAISIRRSLTAAAVCAAALSVTSSTTRLAAIGAQQQEDDGIAPSARAQIQALLEEKETRTPAERKIDSQLLYARRMEMGLPIAPGVQTLEVYVPHADDGHVAVHVKAAITNRLVLQLSGMTGEMKQTGDTDLELHVGLDQIEAIAEQPDVIWVGPRQEAYTSRRDSTPVPGRSGDRAARRAAVLANLRETLKGRPPIGLGAGFAAQDGPPQTTDVYRVGTGQGSASAQSDVTHRTAVFRGVTGFNGAGVKIGVLSDGVTNLAAAQASGDLGAVTVLPGQTGSGDEGTAMLEIVHDLAPGAQLYFATAFTSITSFADNIRALRAAGCDIIVDDVGYYVESPFQDGQGPAVISPTNGGVVTQAVKDVAALGAMYFSSAGNSGNLNDGTSGVWEGDFNLGAATVDPPIPAAGAGNFHRFTGVQDFDTLTVAGSGPISLAWADPLGGSGNDYDLFRLNTAGTTVASSSTNIQNGNDDPYEQVSNSTASPRIVVVKKTGAAARFLHLNTNRGQLSVATAGQTHGHAATSNIFTFDVAATYAGFAYPNPFSTSNVIETFSSDGPRRVFFLGDGTPVTPGNFSSSGGAVLQKPDMTAADGVFVSGAGDFPGQFFGTSAAAPTAAAIMGLIKSQNPGFTQTQLRSALFATALDIEAPGVDRDSGIGVVMATPPQPGCTFAPSPSSVTILPAGIVGGGINVTASSPGCNWVAFSTVPWMRVVAGSVGTGNGSFVVDIAPNHGPTRIGTLMLQGGSVTTITQNGSASTPFDNITPLGIPDNTTVESSLTVSGLTTPITNLTVSLYLTHTFDADLTISLIGPDGTTAKLSVENGGSANNYGSACSPTTSRTTFDDSATNLVVHASAPFVGSFRPEDQLSRFNGKSGAFANGSWKLRITDSFAGDTGTLNCWSLNINHGAIPDVVNDFDGNGLSDLTVFRPGNGQWFVNGGITPQFGLAGDVPVPGDYNGDGLVDVAVYRPSSGQWFVRNGVPSTIQFGRSGDIPVPADYDGDAKTDPAVYRTTDSNAGVWLLNLPGGPPLVVPFGLRGDIPMPGDYDGDGRADLGLYRPATGQWFVDTAASGFTSVSSTVWGIPGDVPVKADVDNDQRTDLVVYRPSNGTWYLAPTNSPGTAIQFGLAGDIPMALDIDGDGFAELCVWRPSTGTWFMRNRITSSSTSAVFGLPGDIPVGVRPQLPSTPRSDFDGDGLSELTVFRPSNGTWFMKFSSTGFVTSGQTQFGLNGDIRVNGDYDGDHRTDLAVWRPSSATWFILQSSNGALRMVQWGLNGDKPMPADYDGDGRTDLAVFRPSNATWFILNSSNNSTTTTQWGLSTDTALAADFDGDGRAELAVFRPSSSTWFLRMSTSAYGAVITRAWGVNGDQPIVGDFDGDGRSELTVYRPPTGEWFSLDALTGALVLNGQFGLSGDTPDTHDYDGDGRTDLAVFRVSSATWFVRRSSNGTLLQVQWGLPTDQPVIIR